MPLSRRHFIAATAATALVPRLAAAQPASDVYETAAGPVTVTPVAHASFVMQVPGLVIHVDPVGDPALYAGLPPPGLILVTHEHGDHYNAETLAALAGAETRILANPAVFDLLPEALKAQAGAIANGETATVSGLRIDAVPAYNTTPERQGFHPEGRDNGYVLHVPGLKTYISGDTEDIPEMRALEGIDLAFLCMNLPFTMSAEQAADATAAFAPKVVYPYHYRNQDGDMGNAEAFAALVGQGAEVRMAAWYG